MNAAHLFIIAGEPSGDQLGAGLMKSLRNQSSGAIQFSGIGGGLMQQEGLSSLFPMSELSVMGFAEVVPHLRNLTRRIKQTVLAIEAANPDMVITIDSPGFTFRVVKALRKRKKITSRFVHYVAPTVWAYKPERAAKTAKLFDHLLVLLPFEPPYFEKVGLPVTFVGHPVLDDLEARFCQRPMAARQLTEEITLCLMAGSRINEIKRLLPIYYKALLLIAPKYPQMKLRIATTAPNEALMVKLTNHWPWPGEIAIGSIARLEAFYESDLAICKSGTVALEASKTGLPLVVVYRVNPLSAMIARRWMKTKFFNLVNILRQKEIIPELMQEQCTPALIAEKTLALLASHHEREKQKNEAFGALREMAAPDGLSASYLAAQTVLKLLGA